MKEASNPEMKIYCIRHGEAEHNIKNMMSEDPSKPINLTEKGKKQASETSEKLKDKKIEKIFVSELPRAKQTADIINKHHHVKVIVDDKLNDIAPGFEGQKIEEWKEFISSNPFNTKKEGSESINDVIDRMRNFIDSLKNRSEKEIVIISHGTPIQVIRYHLGTLKRDKLPTSCPKNAEIIELDL